MGKKKLSQGSVAFAPLLPIPTLAIYEGNPRTMMVVIWRTNHSLKSTLLSVFNPLVISEPSL